MYYGIDSVGGTDGLSLLLLTAKDDDGSICGRDSPCFSLTPTMVSIYCICQHILSSVSWGHLVKSTDECTSLDDGDGGNTTTVVEL